MANQVDSSSSINASFNLFPSQSQQFKGKWEAGLLHLLWPAPGQGLLKEVQDYQQGIVGVEEEISKVSEEPLVVETVNEIKEFLSVKAEEEVDEIEEFLLMGAEEDVVPAVAVEVVELPVASKVSVVGWLASWVGEWVKISASAQVLAWVAQGMPIQLARAVHKTQQAYHLEAEQKEWLIAEVDRSL